MEMYEYPKNGDLKELKIELTKRCPLNCIHCSSEAHPNATIQLAKDAVLALVSQAASMKVKSIVFSGGEPLLWPWLHEAIMACSSAGIRSVVYTTGMSTDGKAARVLIDLSNHGLRGAIFSLYSPHREEHDRITRRSGSYDTTIRTIQDLAESPLERELHFVPFKRNHKDFLGLARLSESLGINKLSVLRFVPQGRGEILNDSREIMGEKETLALRDQILKYQQCGKTRIRLGSPYNIMLLNSNVECIAARNTLCIGPTGNIYPCDAFKNIEPSDLGLVDHYNNVISHSLNECWSQSTYLAAIRRYLVTPFGEPCIDCQELENCKSGCLAQKVLQQQSIEEGNINKRPDPLCLRFSIGEQDA